MRELEASMDTPELMEWIAYEMTNDKDIADRLNKELASERLAQKTKEEQVALSVKQFFTDLVNGPGK